jgi:muconate cycloisomerase
VDLSQRRYRERYRRRGKTVGRGRHQAFKLKIGARELATDLRHTRAIVEALGDRASIRVDVNQAWDAATGAKGCRELAAMGVDLIEQPVSAHDNAALVRLSQHIETAILADEAVATAYDGYQLAQQGFTGAYALKIAKAGGRTACWRWPASRRRRDWPVWRHHAGRHRRDRRFAARLVDAAAAVGHRDVRPAVAERRYCQRAAHLCRRQVALPQTPGLGVELDEDKLHFIPASRSGEQEKKCYLKWI